MSGMYILSLREKGTEDTPFFINIWPDSKRGPKQNDYLLAEHHNKEGFIKTINQLIKKLQKINKKIEKNTSAYKFILKTDHVNEEKHIFYSLELVDIDYELEEDERIVFFDNRVKGYKMDRVTKDMIKQLILMGGFASAYSRNK